MEQKKDKYNIDVIDDCKLYSLSLEDFNHLYTTFPSLQSYFLINTSITISRLLDRISSLHTKKAKAKYIEFCETHEQFYHQIPLKMVASYIGVTQETLSRIRK